MKKIVFFTGALVLAFSLVNGPVSATKGGVHDDNNFYSAWDSKKLYEGKTTGAAYIGAQPRTNITLRGDSGTWTSPVVTTKRPFDSLNPSWQTNTPRGSSVAIELRVRSDDKQWSGWYKMGNWAFENTDSTTRTSTNNQNDEYGTVYTDTYVNTTDKKIDSYQVRATLAGTISAKPRLYQITVDPATSQTFETVSRSDMQKTIDLQVPQFSQYTHEGEYPQFGGGGEAWCSPTSVAMVLKYYSKGPSPQDLASLPADLKFDANGRKDAEVPYAALHTYDQAYEGTGNWPFNTAYAAEYGLRSSVRVFESLRDVEHQIKSGNPVVASIAWNNTDTDTTNDLPNAGVEKTGGHLLVIRGFTKEGNVIVNDPATHGGNSDVRRVYDRTAFERQWINSSNGTVYTFAK